MRSLLRNRLPSPITLILVLCILFCSRGAHPAQAQRPPRVITPLTDAIYAIRFSPDNRTLAIARGSRDDNRVDLWDTQTGALLRAIRGFDGQVWSVSFSPDGRTLVTGSGGVHRDKIADKPRSSGKFFTELKWWDAQSGELIRQLELPGEDRVSVAAFHSPNGKLLALIETRAGLVPMFDNPFNTALVPSAFFFRRSELFADLKLLDARTGETVMKLKEGFNTYTVPFYGRRYSQPDFVAHVIVNQRRQPMIFSPDGQFLCAWNATEIRLWSSLTGEEVRKLKNFKGRLSAIAFSPDGHSLAGAIVKMSVKKDLPEYKSELRVWDIATGAAKKVLPLTTQAVSGLASALNGKQWLISGLERENARLFATLELVDMETGSVGKLTANDESSVSSVSLSPNGTMVAFQTGASTVNLVGTQDWKIKHTFDASTESSSSDSIGRRFLLSVKSVLTVAFSADGTTVTGAIEQGGIKVWDARTGEVKKTVGERPEQTTLADISATGNTTAAILDYQTLHWVDTASGNETIFDEKNGHISAIALSADGKLLAIARGDAIVFVNTANGKLVRTLKGSGKEIYRLAFSPDGEVIATGDADGGIEVRAVAGGDVKMTLRNDGKITALRFAPNGTMLASATTDGKVVVWNLRSASQAMVLKKHTAGVNAIAFSHDEKLLASGGDDRTVIIWEMDKGKARKTLKGHDLSVTSIAFSPGDNLLAAGSGNASVVLWEVQTGRLNRILR